MKLIGLHIENIMGVTAVSIEPGDLPIIKFEGENGAGKTTVLNSFLACLKGMKYLGSGKEALRDGEEDGIIRVCLADPDAEGFDPDRDTLIVERIINKKGDRLKVSSPKGATYSSPAAMLEKLFSAVSIDPEGFKRLDDKGRIDVLLELTGEANKVKELDTLRDKLFQERRDINRDAKEYKTKVGDAMVSGTDKLGEEKKAVEIADMLDAEKKRVEGLESAEKRRDEISAEIAVLKQERFAKEAYIKDNEGDSNLVGLQMELSAVDDFNQGVRLRNQAIADVIELNILEGKSQSLTGQMEKIDSDKTETLKSLPIKGVTIGEDGLRIGGRLCGDLCGYEVIEIGMKIGAAMNPSLRVITIQGGEGLDDKSWAKVEAYAREHKFQVLAAVVVRSKNDKSENSFYIEAGKIA